jgi:signal transduction histidine kinase
MNAVDRSQLPGAVDRADAAGPGDQHDLGTNSSSAPDPDRADAPAAVWRWRNLLPDRIATRIALTVVAAIVLTQVIGFLLIIGDKLPFMLPLRNIDAVTAMIAAPVQRLAITPVGDRPAVAAALGSPDMVIAWQDNYRPAGPDDGRLPAHILSSHLRRYLHGVVDLVLMETVPDPAISDEPPEIPLPPLFGPGGESPKRHSRLWLRLVDQSWVSIEMPNARWLQFNPVHLALWWGLSLLSILWLSLLVAKRVTRPLHNFAAAAERLGTGLDQTMLAETGPEELRQAIQAFNKMQARLKRFIDDRTQMLAAISHDLRTPISRLLLRTSNLPESDERRKMLADLNLMEHMIGATLDFARDDTLSEPQQQVDLGSLIDSLVDDAMTLGGQVSYAGPAYVACICRPVAITRALGNLLDNAVKYGGKTMVSLNNTPAEIVITIEDDGPGIAPEALDKVFEPFIRLDPARPSLPGQAGLAGANLGGVGLGLTIARNVILAHGGDIALSNRSTGGLRVILRLPHHRQASSAANM